MPTAAEIAEHYDALAFIYRNFWGDHIHHGLFRTGKEKPAEAQVAMLDHCATLVDLERGTEVLDVGCGHGGTSIYLARTFRCETVGLTVSAKQAKIARKNAEEAGVAERVNFLHQDAEQFDYPPDRFALVWTMESSEHFQDKAAYFRNVAQALRLGGKLLLAAWTGSMHSPRVREVAQRFLCPAIQSADDYAAQIAAAGLTVQKREELREQVVRTWEISQEYAENAGPMVALLPKAAREFIAGIPVILDAYRSGDLGYTVLTAAKP